MDIKTRSVYAVYKRPTSNLGAHRDWEWGDGYMYYMQMETHIRQNKLLNKDYYKRQRRTLHNDQRSIQEEDITIINVYAPNIGDLNT